MNSFSPVNSQILITYNIYNKSNTFSEKNNSQHLNYKMKICNNSILKSLFLFFRVLMEILISKINNYLV